MRKHSLLATILLLVKVTIVMSQTCNNTFDSISIVCYVKEKGILLKQKGLTDEEINRTPSYQPRVSFDEEKCQWTVISKAYTTTRRGTCKKTNDCTITTTQTISISASNKKIIQNVLKKEITPNYE